MANSCPFLTIAPLFPLLMCWVVPVDGKRVGSLDAAAGLRTQMSSPLFTWIRTLRPTQSAIIAFVLFNIVVGLLIYFHPPWLRSPRLSEESSLFWDQYFKYIGATVAVIGIYLSLSRYFDQRESDLKQRENANQAALIEAQKPFFQKRQDIYEEFLSLTSFLGNLDCRTDDWQAKKLRFWQMYWGILRLVADDEVMDKATGCSNMVYSIEKEPNNSNYQHLRAASAELAQRCRKSLGYVEPHA